MKNRTYQVSAIGSAIVDILARESDAFLKAHGIEKGAMQLVERAQIRALMRAANKESMVKRSGGSAANSLAAFVALGGQGAFIGKVGKDALGDFFSDDIQCLGVSYECKKSDMTTEEDTASALVIVTPDGERSMCVYLGASQTLSADDIAPALIGESDLLYLEGYSFYIPEGARIFAKACGLCREAGTRVALTLSDAFCVQRHRGAFQKIIRDDVDLLFCNRAEILALCSSDDFTAARKEIATQVDILACTDGERGAYIARDGREWYVEAHNVSVVDTTGAGDLFAGGVLFGLSAGYELEHCAKIGCAIAGQIVGEIGARSQADLRVLLVENGLIACPS